MQAVEPIYLLIGFLMGLSSWLGLGINVTIGPPETSVTFGPPSQGVSFCKASFAPASTPLKAHMRAGDHTRERRSAGRRQAAG